MIAIEIPAMFIYYPNLAIVNGAAFIFAANFTHCVKLLNVLWHRDKFLDLIDFFVASITKQDLKNDEVLKILIRNEKKSWRDVMFVIGISTCALISLFLDGDRMDPTGLPMVGIYPFRVDYSPLFELLYVHQMFAVSVAAFFNVALDVFTNNLSIHLCCQFELLKRDIAQIAKIEPDDEERISQSLNALVDRHHTLKRRCLDLNRTIGVAILGQFLGSVFIICITMYQLHSGETKTFIEKMAVFVTICWASFQPYFYCYYGNDIMLQVCSMTV